MKLPFALTLAFNVLFLWQTCLVAEVKRYEADVCVYGGTASGVMAALADQQDQHARPLGIESYVPQRPFGSSKRFG